MIAIVCIDDKNGMLFNNRRQSKDQILRQDIYKQTNGKILWMNEFSYHQFEEDGYENICVEEQFYLKAKEEEYCFIETLSLLEIEDKIDRLILYRWNRTYPADFWFDLPLEEQWKLENVEEFPGKSHEKITKEEYIRC